MTDRSFSGLVIFGDDRDEPKHPCELCHNRLAQHGHVVDGKLQYVCCRCWIWVLDRAPVEWHIECPQYHVEKRGKAGSEPGNLVITTGSGRPKKRRRG